MSYHCHFHGTQKYNLQLNLYYESVIPNISATVLSSHSLLSGHLSPKNLSQLEYGQSNLY